MATTLAVAPLMPAVDARLCLSLDDLIKERKKENKQKKRESVKQETKPAPQDAKKSKAKAQAEQRKAVMNKNRGLPAPKQTTESSGKQQKKPQQRQKKKKTTKAAAPVQQSAGPSKHQNKKTKNAPHANGSQLSNGQTKKKKTTTTVVEHKKVDNKKMAKPQPTLSPKRQQNKNQRMAPSSPKQNREVTKPRNGVKLTITLKRSRGDVRRMKKQQQQQKKQQRSVVVKPRVMKALLPGKTQPKTKKILAQHIVKKVKTSRKQQAASKSSRQGQFIVRKPVVVRRVKSERR
ncbi:hypothetical protein Poli38472_002314 [Pythium oligandrum]|uniref:Uncharacterized protein n=1 Tax=Pythium oligandrum TaxID=41045 RepID=A0A8K1FM69_PYTOL|nr:hypothetical protein Poli38472_002314 [Pythium oligandrum]|eukprot:TMW63373.1 hypothetical protein Poli38472_002314 [Pythium oligandrum]